MPPRTPRVPEPADAGGVVPARALRLAEGATPAHCRVCDARLPAARPAQTYCARCWARRGRDARRAR